MSLVFFDFDGTLTKRDTILPLGLFIARKTANKHTKICLLILQLAMLKLRLISNHEFKERFCKLLLRGQSEEAMVTATSEFVRDYVEGVLKQPSVEVLLDHVARGDEVYLVSSNFSLVLRHLQSKWLLRGVVGTEAERASGRFTGRLVGHSCDGEEKLARVVALFGEEKVRAATAYGDSRGDNELLSSVKEANWV